MCGGAEEVGKDQFRITEDRFTEIGYGIVEIFLLKVCETTKYVDCELRRISPNFFVVITLTCDFRKDMQDAIKMHDMVGAFEIKAGRFVEIDDGAVVIALPTISEGAAYVAISMFRVEADRFVKISDGVVVIGYSNICAAADVIGSSAL